MNYKNLLLTAIVIGLLSFSHNGWSQSFYKEKIPRNYYWQIGAGPSLMYGDNSGSVRKFDFKVSPSFSAAIARKVNSFLDVKSTVGYQRLRSQSIDYFEPATLHRWSETNQAVENKGNAIFIDVMPSLNLIKFENHALRKSFNIYGGMGIGVLMTLNEEIRIENGQNISQNTSVFSWYLPFRGGISYKIGLHSDIALEGSLFLTFSDELDGNTGFNRFNDHLLQGQIVYRRYLSPLKSVY